MPPVDAARRLRMAFVDLGVAMRLLLRRQAFMFDVTLSFDNGPELDVTPGVLALLKQWRINATFFVVGNKLNDRRCFELASRARDDGHWIGNHTLSHTVPLGMRSESDVAELEIEPAQRLLGALAHPDRLFRPFGGGGNLDTRLLRCSVVEYLVRERYTCVLWNAVPGDWFDPDGWVERALEQCRSRPWTLLVLHDLPTGAMTNLEQFLRRATDMGARFRQDFPPECVIIRAGAITADIAPYVSDAAD
jgi:peptidoglycan/xylan/chitin deacetylase (PgdA/CDA1 family)